MEITLESGRKVTLTVGEDCLVVAEQDNLEFTGKVLVVSKAEADIYTKKGHFVYPSWEGFVVDYQQWLAEEAWNDSSDLYARIAENGRVKHALDRSPYDR